MEVGLGVRHPVEDVPDPVDRLLTWAGDLLRNDDVLREEAAELPVVAERLLPVLVDEAQGLGERVDRDVAERGAQAEPVVGVPVGEIQPVDRLAQAVRVRPERRRIRGEELCVDEDEGVPGLDDVRRVRDVAVAE